MKYKLLHENEPIIIEKILNHFSFPVPFSNEISTSERVLVDTVIYTDGQTKEVNHLNTYEIIGCQVNGIHYQPSVDTYNANELYLKNANYVIKVTKSIEFYRTAKGGGNRWSVRNIEIYLKDPKNKEVLKEVKCILKEQGLYMYAGDYFIPTSKKGISVTASSELYKNGYKLSKRKK